MSPIQIYKALKEKIIWLELKPETTLNLTELAESFGVSRSPITLALTRLDADGWVMYQGSHYVVSPLSLERIKEMDEIRSILEVQANVLAMYRITQEELVALNRLEKEIAQLDQTATNRQLLEKDFEFHRTLFKAANNNHMAQILDNILGQYQRFWLSVIPRNISPQPLFKETLEMIRAIKAKDEHGLREASIRHIKRSFDGIMGRSIENGF